MLLIYNIPMHSYLRQEVLGVTPFKDVMREKSNALGTLKLCKIPNYRDTK
ncbi:hypothetical protein KVM35_02400 [Helicobacter pylori]|nr:hypothetical protein KVM35_02400 [Helicobacter pylori]